MSKIDRVWIEASSKNGEEKNDSLEELGTLLWMEGEHDASIAVLNELRDLLKAGGATSDWLHQSWLVSFRYKVSGDFELALDVLDESLELAQELSETENLPYLLELRAQLLNEFEKTEEAETMFHEAASAFQVINESAKVAECRIEIARILYRKHLFHPAIAQARFALEEVQSTGDAQITANAREVLAFCFMAQKEYVRSRKQFQLSLNIQRFLRNQVDEMRLRTMLGSVESILGNQAIALELLSSVANVRGDRRVNIEAANAMLEIAKHNFRFGNRQLAKSQEREALEILKSLGV